MAVVDVYDALRTARPYKSPMPHAAAIDVLRRETDKGAWDPRVLAAFIALAPDLLAVAAVATAVNGGPRNGPPNPPTLVAPRRSRGAPRFADTPDMDYGVAMARRRVQGDLLGWRLVDEDAADRIAALRMDDDLEVQW